LPAMRASAQFEGQYAPRGNLALFSGVLAAPQADWPPGITICGFSRYDGRPVDPALRLELDDWLSAGPAPVVFTLGSSVSMYATDFFGMAIDAARRIGRRALLITGQDPTQYDTQIASAGLAPRTVKVFRYLPYSGVFPRAAVTVHQAGIGTLAQALAAGKPQLIVPVGFDQPDNARRAVRLGVARSIPFQKLAAATMARALRDLLASPAPAATARTIARIVEAEEQEQRAAALLSA
jgi:rhamnosyltransferase subunit B